MLDEGEVIPLATTRLISMHKNKGESIADCLADRTRLRIKIPIKLMRVNTSVSYECDPKTVQGEFLSI